MNIACVHLSLARALADQGHQVLELHPPPGLVRLGPLLGDFVPDLLIQQETLGPRTLLADLESLSCYKVFWSVDTHLNSFWQRYYARLFDLFCTTQQDWLPWFSARGIRQNLWLPWFGVRRNLAPWEARHPDPIFVGRVTPQRPVRGWFLELLHTVGPLRLEQNLDHAAMLNLYDQARIVPNESIFGEINFRLFEAASCACAVINPDLPGLADLFTPGEEVAHYRDGVELSQQVTALRANPALARLMGIRARQRVLQEHLAEHRAATLLDQIATAERSAAVGVTGRIALWLSVLQLWEAGHLTMHREDLEATFLRLPTDEEVLAALLRLRSPEQNSFQELALPVIQSGQYASSPLVNLAGSMGSLRQGDLPLARLFFLRHLRCTPQAPDPGQDAVSICLAWARELQRMDEHFRPGFVFDPTRNLPESALECLVLASEHAPQNQDIYRDMARLLARSKGWEALRLQALSYCGLRERSNWRLGLELGVTNCQAFRVNQGLEELLLALDEARKQKAEARFWSMLHSLDQSGQMAILMQTRTQNHYA